VSADAGPLAGRHVLLGVSGGISAYKAVVLAREFLKAGATVQAVLTPAATRFVGAATFEGITGRPAPSDVFANAHRVPHVSMAREADVAVVAPATADVLAKFANGLADDLLSNVFLCLNVPVVLAPAMHTEMWEHPATRANVETLRARGAEIVGPDEGQLAGGDEGPGRLAEETAVLDAVVRVAGRIDGSLVGKHAVVTAGGTREAIDPVRYIGNRSSGKMGYALAAELARRGATVDLVSGPTALRAPAGVRRHDVESALEMREAVMSLAQDADIVVKAAAVADFRPAVYHKQKLKKESDDYAEVVLTRNPDILAELGARKDGRLLVGFAAETDLEEERGREKLHRKGIDLIVINRVDMADAGFGVDTNRALLLDASGGRTEVPLTTKTRLAAVICDQVERLLPGRTNEQGGGV
jgi:phosphopantothenoylcysteine decarboxylase / phosphopantothenate---cysteine ligase